MKYRIIKKTHGEAEWYEVQYSIKILFWTFWNTYSNDYGNCRFSSIELIYALIKKWETKTIKKIIKEIE